MNLSLEKLLATCKRENPARLVAYLGNDEERAISVKGGRKRWANTIATIEALHGWTRVELLDKSGALLATVENTDPAGELEDLRPGRGGVWDQVERGLNVVLKAQDAYAKSRGAEMQTVLQAQTELMRETSAAVKSLVSLHNMQLATVRETEAAKAEAAIAAAAGTEGGIEKLLEPLMPALVPMLAKFLAGGSPAPSSPNGARKAAG